MKILTQIIMFVLAVHITLAFAQQDVTITVTKDIVEPDLAGYKLYQDGNTEPFAVINSSTSPAIWEGQITLVNGQTSICATAFDNSDNESQCSRSTVFDPPPGIPRINVEVKIIVDSNAAE
jgi:hypothetical protein